MIRPSRMGRPAGGARSRLALFWPLGLAVSVMVVGCGPASESGEAQCAAVIELYGHTYWGQGETVRTPATTGRSLPAVLPGCDDTGGQDEPEEDESVEALELADVDPSVAVLYHDGIYVRDGAELPDATQVWFRAPRCATAGDFQLTADWLRVRSTKKVRFDGDIRRPYRLRVEVTDGPSRYVGTKLTLHSATSTGPTLSPEAVKESLWEGGQVIATVRCDRAGFELVAVRAVPPA